MNYLIAPLLAVVTFIGGIFSHAPANYQSLYDAGSNNYVFGSISFPTSLDNFTNPGATDSVATVSHSAQHSNENDAIEALETKVKTDGSISNGTQVFASNGTNSGWTSYATTTSLLTGSATTTTFLATGSSTLQNFTFVNATGTQATTTSLFATTASSTKTFGAGLSACTGGNKLLWSNGSFSCGTDLTGAGTLLSTTTSKTAFASTTAMTSGTAVAIWAKCTFANSGTVTTALYVKPASSATSSALSISQQSISGGATLQTTQVLFGVYRPTATENHEIYIGNNDANKNYSNCDAIDAPGILTITF